MALIYPLGYSSEVTQFKWQLNNSPVGCLRFMTYLPLRVHALLVEWGAHAYTDLDVIQEWAPNPSRGHWPGDEPSYNGFDGPHRGVCG